MSNEMKELETEVMRLMKNASRTKQGGSVVWGEALKAIQTAKKTGEPSDILKAYQWVLDLGYTPSDKMVDDIHIVLDAIAWYGLHWLPANQKGQNEALAYSLVSVDLRDPLIKHWIVKWQLQDCFKSKPDSDEFWQAWYQVFELTIKYQAIAQEQLIRRLFAAYNRDLKVRKIG
jgi:hypothetical protein